MRSGIGPCLREPNCCVASHSSSMLHAEIPQGNLRRKFEDLSHCFGAESIQQKITAKSSCTYTISASSALHGKMKLSAKRDGEVLAQLPTMLHSLVPISSVAHVQCRHACSLLSSAVPVEQTCQFECLGVEVRQLCLLLKG